MEEKEGVLAEIIYQNEVNSYTVGIFETEEEQFTVVGYLPFINKGDSLKIVGKFVEHKDYGEQFKIETFEKIMPRTLGALENYLASGNIKGVGPATAKKIVKLFGEETIHILKYEPEKLSQIKGITKDKAKEISESFIENWEVWQIVGFLEKFGIGAESAKKVYNLLGINAIQEIEADPYILIDISRGVDFNQIDQMAIKLGIDKENQKRIKSGIKYALIKITYNGHCCTLKENLIEYVKQLLGVSKEVIEEGLITLKVNDDIVIEDSTDDDNASIEIVNGSFTSDVSDYLAEDSHLVEIDGEYVVMDEDEYDDYLDDQRDSGRHSYSLKEGKTERDDEEEEPVVTPEPEEEEGPFSDVGKDNPNYDAIVEVYEKGWMAGIGDGVFAPNGTLTRGMAVTILWNRAGQPEPASVAPFLDVTSDAWYAKAVAWAYENGITSGYGDTYGPDDFLTTEQFTRMNDIANGRTPEVYVGGAPNATRGWVAGMLVME